MSLETWLAFAGTSAVLLAIPGPTILLVVSYALGHGRRSALPTVAGVALGDLTAMTGSMLGLGALLAASAVLFTALKWIGAAYLVFLGIKLWRAPVRAFGDGSPEPLPRHGRMFAHAYAVTALNPKGIIFFLTFLPQFLDTTRPVLPQMLMFGATFLALAIVNALAYALLAAAARRGIRRPSVQRTINRIGGSLLIGAGALAAGWRGASS